MRALIVSSHFPANPSTYVYGAFKRQRMFIDAIKGLACLDALFYVRPDMDCSPDAVAEWERRLSERWATDVCLFLCPGHVPKGQANPRLQHVYEALSFFAQVGNVFTSPRQVQALERCLKRNPDIIFAQRMVSMCQLLISPFPLPPVFLDFDDIEHVCFVRGIDRGSPLRSKAVQYLKLPAILYAEQRCARLAHRSFVCSEEDRTYLSKWWRLPRVAVAPNAVDGAPFLPLATERTLLFLGSFKYKPNVDAARFLIEQIWPKIHQQMPDARLIVAGIFSESVDFFKSSLPGVEFAGFVEDLEGLYRRSRVVCAPILSGSGTRVKILEAASYGKPVVATKLGAEGLGLRDEADILLRDGPAEFAAACLRLLREDELCRKLGGTLRGSVMRRFSRASVIEFIQKEIMDSQSFSKNISVSADDYLAP